MSDVRSCAALVILLVASLLVGVPREAKAQRWLQTAELEVPIEDERRSALRAFLDTLTNVIERRDSLLAMRDASQEEGVSFSALQDKLVNGPGVSVGSASHVRIDYRFAIKNRGYEETIQSVQFLFRAGPEQGMIPLLYVDGQAPWVQNILHNKGLATLTNCPGLLLFSDKLVFARLVQSGKIMEIAENDVRVGFEEKKRKLTRKIERLTYESQ